jgi:hypothetical protein
VQHDGAFPDILPTLLFFNKIPSISAVEQLLSRKSAQFAAEIKKIQRRITCYTPVAFF